ncbi:MAG: C1 family peptidase [Halobacteriota archaeon]
MDTKRGNINVIAIVMTMILTLSLLSGSGAFVEFQELNISISKQESPIEDYYDVPIARGCDFRWYGDGVWSEYPCYEPYDDFIDYSQFANYGDGSYYTIYFYEYAPDGTLIWTDSTSDWLPGGYYITWTVTLYAPVPGGWEIGDYKFCSKVVPGDCDELPTKCCNNTVRLSGEPDINVTPEHLDFECCEEACSLNADITTLKGSEFNCTQSGSTKAEGEVIGIKNPAAVYCMDMGYEYKIEKGEKGERGICVMPDKAECDAWAFYRGECGREFSYCAKKGWLIASKGKKDCFATNSTTCVLPDGTRKTVSELLNLSEKCKVGKIKLGKNKNKSVGDTDFNKKEIKEKEISLPNHFDWRNKDGGDWMTPVKDQGSCGSCWAFSGVGIVEPEYNILYDNPELDFDLSEQYLVSDCCIVCGDCNGGWHSTALEFIRDEGITDEACFPYIARNCPCSDRYRCPDWSDRLKKIDETGSVPSDIETIKDSLIEKGPLSVAMGIGSEFGGYFDVNGVYRCTDDNDVNHAVVIAGYDETGDYWIVKNSWGSGWNGDGYFKVGYGECAIENFVYYANLTAGVNCKTFTVSNAGNGSLVVDDIGIHYQSGSGWLDANPRTFTVSPGGSKLVNVCVNCTGLSPGEYHGWLNISSNDPDEDPYAVTVTLTVKYPEEKPDLKITDTWQENCTICYNVTNVGNGTAPAPAGHNTMLFVDGVEKVYDSVPVNLAPNASYLGCFNYTWAYTPPGDIITVCADSNNTMAESNETNNCLTETWKCGDVNCNEVVDMPDVIDLLYYVGYPGQYRFCNEWAADVNCDKRIDMSDVIDLLYYVGYPGQYDLKCCCKISG